MKRLLPLLLLFVAASAAAQTWRIDPQRSSIGFTIRHMVVSKAKGTFRKFTGTATGDPANPTAATLEITIDAASIDTGNADRDKDLRSDNFFDVAKYPAIVFRSKRIVRQGGGLAIVGDLTMHGVTKEVTLAVDRFAAAGANRVQASAKTKINRKDFGITWNRALDGGGVALSDDASVVINVEFVRQ
jgi:polyisoprenoid-binding protein YceI